MTVGKVAQYVFTFSWFWTTIIISKQTNTMKTNSQLAQIVAERVSDRVFEDMMELIADITHDVMVEQGIDVTTEEAYSEMLDISSRIYLGAQ